MPLPKGKQIAPGYSPSNYTPAGTTLDDHLSGIDAALGGGTTYHYTEHFADLTSVKLYWSFVDSGANSAIATDGMTMIAKHDGSLIAATVWASFAAGSTVMGLHKNGNTTASFTDTRNLPATTSTEFIFSSATFSKGDRLHISIDATDYPYDTYATLQWEYDTST